ncbi:MAG: hypothetical protein ABEJ58_09060 [Halodesulfurarchaeum sp.]
MRIRSHLGISDRRQEQVSRILQVSLLAFFFLGLSRGNLGVIVNSLVAIAVTSLPAVLERDYQISIDPGLALWISGAVFLHALGTVGLPVLAKPLYQSVWWWDHLTHALSASLVGATGYATVRALDRHTEDLYFPPAAMFVLILLIVLAFGVLWEILEFAIAGISHVLGATSVLTQYGIGDTMLDLVFDAFGAVVVATWGTAYLAGVSDVFLARLESIHENAKR